MAFRRFVSMLLILAVFSFINSLALTEQAQAGNSNNQGGGDEMIQKATFAAGCFWEVEAAFDKVKGVISTRVGYTGGTSTNPSYEDVCYGNTGHAEAVEVKYDSSQVSFEELLYIFWDIHNPTTLNRQGPDIGSQYRSAIFFHSSEQEKAAKESKAKLQNSGRYKENIVTQILPAPEFYEAEEYHQKYLEKKGLPGCRI